MIIAVDFDGTVVEQDHPYEDLEAPLRLVAGAREALLALKQAGHVLILYSARANQAKRVSWALNPLWRRGKVPFDPRRWASQQPLEQARYQQMLDFVERELSGLFDAVDDGSQGKVSADLYIDDRALRFERGGWSTVAAEFGEGEAAE